MHRTASFIAMFCAALLWAAPGSAAEARPNIVLLMADNWAWPHASACGDAVVNTPTFDALAEQGMLFHRAYCSVPSCAPARAVLLTGQAAHRLEDAASLQGQFPADIPVLSDLLEQAGYFVGYSGKGWSPGNWQASGRARNPAGDSYESLAAFLDARPAGKPFFFWHSSKDPHVPWETGAEFLDALDESRVEVPPHLPDHADVRDDMLRYYCEVQNFDRDCGKLLALLEERKLGDAVVIITGDNGWQVPRGLSQVYDLGTHVPLAIRWPGHIEGGSQCDAFISFEDFAPTFLEIAGAQALPQMTGGSLVPLLKGGAAKGRDAVFLERERHANVRQGNLSYPVRAVRTADYLYVQNLRPDRLPSGDPSHYWAVDRYGDTDLYTRTKELLLSDPDSAELRDSFQLVFGRRPAEELYDLRADPGETRNLALDPKLQEVKRQLRERLTAWRERTGDPRLTSDDDRWDRYPYYGPPREGSMVLASEMTHSQAKADGHHDEVRTIFQGVTPNKLVCDTTLREMPDGSWVMVMLGGADREPRPGNGVYITRSLDRGLTWSSMEPVELQVPPDPDMKAMVPSELTVHEGRCMLWFSTHNGRFDNWKSWVATSDDSCQTFSTPRRAPDFLADRTFIRNCIVTSDGRLMLPYQHYVDGPGPVNPRNGVLISGDGGRTWSVHGSIRLDESDEYRCWAEPNIAELRDGSIAMLIRADRKGVLYRSDSTDGGLTWSKARPTDIPNPGSKITLYGLDDGSVALLHNPNPKKRNPLSLWVSFDDMQTWPYQRVLVDTPGSLNYPDGFVGRDGQILHFAFDDNRHRAVYVGARLPAVHWPEASEAASD